MMILNESFTVTAQEISADTRQVLEIFQEALAIIYKFYHSERSRDKRGSLPTVEDFKKLKREMIRFHNYPFMKPVINQLAEIQRDIIDFIQAQRQVSRTKRSQSLPSTQSVIDIWKQGNVRAAINSTQAFSGIVAAATRVAQDPLQSRRNPFYIENPLIFRTSNFLRQFERSDILTVINRDFSVYKYSYLPLNEISKNDFQYIAYFILKLEQEPVQKELSGSALSKYFDMAFQDEEYKRLVKLIEEYLSDNRRENIPEILELIDKFPEIKQANENAKTEIEYVYRGYPDDPDYYREDLPDILATSKFPSVARNFALQIGHLESEENRRSEVGVIDTYRVTPESIILDTTIFGGIFGEGEVIINPNLAVLEDSQTI
jgi:predicted house-cleaning noncanonical NTP pyrophosphatase (MazG superfamily)